MDNTNTTANTETEITTEANSWWLSPEDITATLEKIAKFRKVVAKLGMTTDVALHLGETQTFTTHHELTGVEYNKTNTLCTITGTDFVLPGGNQLAATLDIDPEGTIIRSNPAFTAAEVPAEFHAADGTRCDHCGIRQHRKQAVVVWSETDGFKQVGYTCVKPYLGISPASLFKFVQEMNEVTNFSGFAARTATTTDLYVRLAALATLTYGFVKSNSQDSIPTRNVVADALHYNADTFKKEYPLMANASDAVLAAAADLANAAMAWAKEQNGNEYLSNLRIASQRYVATGNEGLLASLPAAYQRNIADAAEKIVKADKPVSEWLGTAGEKITFTAAITRLTVEDGDYGPTAFAMLVTETGAQVWYTTSPGTAAYNELADAQDREAQVQVTATVKNVRTNRNNDKVTVITRAKAQMLAIR